MDELTEARWALLAPLLPSQKPRGHKCADDRATLNGSSSCCGGSVGGRTSPGGTERPPPFGCAQGKLGWERLRAWEADGTWQRVWQELLGTLDAQGKLEWTQAFLDGSFVPAKRGARPSA